MIVVDSSALVTALTEDGAPGDRARLRLAADGDQHAPHLIDVEAVAAFRNLVARNVLTPGRAETAMEILAGIKLKRYPHGLLLAPAWRLRHNLVPYDGVYAALAAALDAPLVTADRRLANAPGLPCTVELLA